MSLLVDHVLDVVHSTDSKSKQNRCAEDGVTVIRSRVSTRAKMTIFQECVLESFPQLGVHVVVRTKVNLDSGLPSKKYRKFR